MFIDMEHMVLKVTWENQVTILKKNKVEVIIITQL